MIVRCENCQTEFALDASQVTSEGVTVRCSVCAHVFRVAPPQGGPTDQPWQIRTVENRLFTAVDLAMLYQWVKEGRLHPDDQVSRTGHAWLKLGEIPEFSRLFTDFEGLPAVFRTVERGGAVAAGGSAFAPPAPSRPHAVASAGRLGPRIPDHVSRPTQPWGAPVTPSAEYTSSSSPEPTYRGSMLRAVTHHENPDSGPYDRATSSVDDESESDVDLDETGPSPSHEYDQESSVGPLSTNAEPLSRPFDDVRFDTPSSERRDSFRDRDDSNAGSPRLAAFLGGFTGVVVVALVAGIAAYAMGVRLPTDADATEHVQGPGEVTADTMRQIDAALAARDRLSIGEITATEAALQRALDGGKISPAERAALAAAQADVLATRALGRSIVAVLVDDEPVANELRRAAELDTVRARTALASVQAPVPESLDVSAIRARLRLAEGAGADELASLLVDAPKSTETRVLVEAASLWRDASAEVPPSLDTRLEAVAPRTGLGRALLVLIKTRQGDATAAATVRREALTSASDHPLAVLGAPPAAEPSDAKANGDAKGKPPAVATNTKPPPATAKPPPVESRSKSRSRSAGETESEASRSDKSKGSAVSVDRLVDEGCSHVEKQRPSSGVEPLRQALERSPRNLDALVCLASAYAAMSNLQSAQKYYQRALDISGRHRTALAGAARVAERMGMQDQALRYYRRLLAVDPSHAAAKSYVAQHGGDATKNAPGGSSANGNASTDDSSNATNPNGATPQPSTEPSPTASTPSGSDVPSESDDLPTPPSPNPPTPGR